METLIEKPQPHQPARDVPRSALRYIGGKWALAPWIISHMPAHRVYVEPFGGAASVLLRKPRSKVEVYNDADEEIVGIFRIRQAPMNYPAASSGVSRSRQRVLLVRRKRRGMYPKRFTHGVKA
jgi:DNA adenine methylase